MNAAVYAGSFDPITRGHLWMIDAAKNICDRLFVTIATNPHKRYTFTEDERMRLTKQVCTGYGIEVCILPPKMPTIIFAHSIGARHLIRGVRNHSDMEFEQMQLAVNRRICNSVNTIFLMPPAELATVSSSMVKSLVGLNGWQDLVQGYTYPCVIEALSRRES